MNVTIYSDGSGTTNKPGGWAAVVIANNLYRYVTGAEENTTNCRMELSAAIGGIQLLNRKCSIELVSDAEYVVNPLTEGWLDTWAAKRFLKKGQPITNGDLWRHMHRLRAQHIVTARWVKGHKGDTGNEMCDKLATLARLGAIDTGASELYPCEEMAAHLRELAMNARLAKAI